MSDARKAALLVLEKCRRSDAWSDAVMGSVLDREELSGRDRSFATILCYGVLQNRLLLDYVIERSSNISLRNIEPKVLDILRMSVFQILMLDRVPAAAAVSEAVRLCRNSGFARASGYVNAVLRKVAERGIEIPKGNSPEELSVRFSHPLWLVQLYYDIIGADETESLLHIQNSTVPVTLQVNTLISDSDSLYTELCEAGLTVEQYPDLPDCLLITHGGDITRLPAFQRGAFYVQDPAAKMAVMAARPRPGMNILDVCAAPGGKSFAAAILAKNVQILSCDIHENKLKRIRDGCKRLGLTQINTAMCDARCYQPKLEARFDLVMTDVPCSGLGVIRKKPDIRYKNPAEFSNLPGIQSAILRNASRYVAPGGVLLYSTCTVRREENEEVVTAFLEDNPLFTTEDFELPHVGSSTHGMLQLWPQRHNTDGFFIAKLRRIN